MSSVFNVSLGVLATLERSLQLQTCTWRAFYTLTTTFFKEMFKCIYFLVNKIIHILYNGFSISPPKILFLAVWKGL